MERCLSPPPPGSLQSHSGWVLVGANTRAGRTFSLVYRLLHDGESFQFVFLRSERLRERLRTTEHLSICILSCVLFYERIISIIWQLRESRDLQQYHQGWTWKTYIFDKNTNYKASNDNIHKDSRRVERMLTSICKLSIGFVSELLKFSNNSTLSKQNSGAIKHNH